MAAAFEDAEGKKKPHASINLTELKKAGSVRIPAIQARPRSWTLPWRRATKMKISGAAP
jgi:hypothetical protein